MDPGRGLPIAATRKNAYSRSCPVPCGTPTPSNPSGCSNATGGLGWKPVEVAVGTVLVIDGIALLVVSPEAAAAVSGVLVGMDAKGCFADQNASSCQWLLLDLTGIGIGEYAAKGIRAFKLSGSNTLPIERQASKVTADGWNFCLDYCDDAIDWTSYVNVIWSWIFD